MTSNSRPRFRPARESDALDLACLTDSASRGLAAWLWSTMSDRGQSVIEFGRSRIRANTESPLYYKYWTVAEIDGAIAGAVTGRLIPIPYERGDAADLSGAFVPLLELEAVAAGTWYITVVSVYPEFRGQGLGSMLLGKAEEIACASGAGEMSIMVEDANSGALKLYLRYGFTEWTRRTYVPFPGSMDEGDWILLKKKIG
jgi:ribosomal protein S18 acetylase RimI-like enzyme